MKNFSIIEFGSWPLFIQILGILAMISVIITSVIVLPSGSKEREGEVLTYNGYQLPFGKGH